MEIVIKIDDELYNEILSRKYSKTRIEKAVANGKPLPEHHADLIERRCGNKVCNGCEHLDICDIYNAPTVIEAEVSE